MKFFVDIIKWDETLIWITNLRKSECIDKREFTYRGRPNIDFGLDWGFR